MFWLVGLWVTCGLLLGTPRPGTPARLATEEPGGARKAAQRAAPEGRRDAQRAEAAEGTIHLNFRNADILQIVNLMSELTGKNFLVDDKVRGKVTIIAPKPVTMEEAYQVFLSVLEIQGFTVVPQGPIIKIIPSRDVKDNPIPTATDTQRPFSPTTESFVTQLIPLHYADANDIRGLLTPLVSKESSLLAYAPTNSLIITDTVSNINRLLKIITALDVEAPSAIFKVVSLKHAQAEQIANALRTAIEGLTTGEAGGAGPGAEGGAPPGVQPAARGRRPAQATAGQRAQRGPRVIPDMRTNSLVLIATRSEMALIEELITKLDGPTPEGRGQIHVYYLKYANAEELAQVLTAQSGEVARTLTPGTSGLDNQRSTGLGGLGGIGQSSTTTGLSTGLGSTTSPLGSSTQARRQGVTAGTNALGISIVADKPTNSLVITAPPEAYTIIRDIIDKLDVRRAQVLVESLIAEVTLEKAQRIGAEWRLINPPGGLQAFGGVTGGAGEGSLLNAATLSPNALLGTGTEGLVVGALKNFITLPGGGQILNIPALIRAFQSDTDVNILATPNLLTTDNEEAEIIVGENRPVIRSSQSTPITSGVVNPNSTVNTFDFRDLGIRLRITPQISQGKTVRLKLDQEVSNFVSENPNQPGAITTTKRSAKTTVIVDDNQTIVIGGLIQDNINDATSQVPCLGNVPILGWAFKQTSATKRKTNLLIFLTPRIVSTPDDVDRVTTHKRQQSEKAEEIKEHIQDSNPQERLELLLN
ncbi:MAG: type II secretion system secretin GspD [Candidatus Tectimicrobiota bacterium]